MSMAKAVSGDIGVFSPTLDADLLAKVAEIVPFRGVQLHRLAAPSSSAGRRTLSSLLLNTNVPGTLQRSIIVDTSSDAWARGVRDAVLVVPGHIGAANWYDAANAATDCEEAVALGSPWRRGHHLGLLHAAVALNRAAALYREGLANDSIFPTSAVLSCQRRTVFAGCRVLLPRSVPMREYLEGLLVAGGGMVTEVVADATHVVYHPSEAASELDGFATSRRKPKRPASSGSATGSDADAAEVAARASTGSRGSSVGSSVAGDASATSSSIAEALGSSAFDPDDLGLIAAELEPPISSDAAFVLPIWVERSHEHMAQLPPIFFSPQHANGFAAPAPAPFASAVRAWHPVPRRSEDAQTFTPAVSQSLRLRLNRRAPAEQGADTPPPEETVSSFGFVATWLFLQLVAPACNVRAWPLLADARKRVEELLRLPKPSVAVTRLLAGAGAPAITPRAPRVEGATATGFILSEDEERFAAVFGIDFLPAIPTAKAPQVQPLGGGGDAAATTTDAANAEDDDAAAAAAAKTSRHVTVTADLPVVPATRSVDVQVALSRLPPQRHVEISCTLEQEDGVDDDDDVAPPAAVTSPTDVGPPLPRGPILTGGSDRRDWRPLVIVPTGERNVAPGIGQSHQRAVP